jgi:hypothetical protein
MSLTAFRANPTDQSPKNACRSIRWRYQKTKATVKELARELKIAGYNVSIMVFYTTLGRKSRHPAPMK